MEKNLVAIRRRYRDERGDEIIELYDGRTFVNGTLVDDYRRHAREVRRALGWRDEK